jgi:hypothetical protein
MTVNQLPPIAYIRAGRASPHRISETTIRAALKGLPRQRIARAKFIALEDARGVLGSELVELALTLYLRREDRGAA